MKLFLPVTIAAIFLFSANLQAQNFEDPGEYMTFLSKQQENISKKFMSYASASAHGKKARKVENLRSKLLNEVQEARMNISGMPSYKGDKSYRDTTVNFMKLYYNVLNDDYSKIINMEDVAEQSYDAMEAYMIAKEMVEKKLEEGNGKMKAASAEFAAKNNIMLTEDKSELGDMMKQVHEMNTYYNVIYLIFFKPYKQEMYMMDAMEKGNITGIEQNRNSLLKYAQDGLEKLKAIQAFKGDNSLVNSCRNMLNFYVKEADKMSGTSEYFLTKERFDAIKKDYDRKSKPSKEDVDAYNKGVIEVNKATDNFNNNNNMLNKLRKDEFKSWNDGVNDFFDNHTPRYK